MANIFDDILSSIPGVEVGESQRVPVFKKASPKDKLIIDLTKQQEMMKADSKEYKIENLPQHFGRGRPEKWYKYSPADGLLHCVFYYNTTRLSNMIVKAKGWGELDVVFSTLIEKAKSGAFDNVLNKLIEDSSKRRAETRAEKRASMLSRPPGAPDADEED